MKGLYWVGFCQIPLLHPAAMDDCFQLMISLLRHGIAQVSISGPPRGSLRGAPPPHRSDSIHPRPPLGPPPAPRSEEPRGNEAGRGRQASHHPRGGRP
jgi:hypothetical protein